MIAQAVQVAVGENTIPILSVGQLIINKREVGQPTDLAMLPELEHLLQQHFPRDPSENPPTILPKVHATTIS